MHNYREIWDEQHYKYGAAKDLKYVSWEEFKTIRKAQNSGNNKRVLFEVLFSALVIVGLFFAFSIFSMV
jgi:hypothetical protein